MTIGVALTGRSYLLAGALMVRADGKLIKAACCFRSGEDAHPAGAHEETDDDEHDAPEQLLPDDRDDSGDDEDDRKDPQ